MHDNFNPNSILIIQLPNGNLQINKININNEILLAIDSSCQSRSIQTK